MATGDEKVDLSEPGAASRPDPSRRAKRGVGDVHDFPGHSFTDNCCYFGTLSYNPRSLASSLFRARRCGMSIEYIEPFPTERYS
jgi:hypothetical protein